MSEGSDSARPYNVLVLCTGNSARSVIGEALFNVLGKGRFVAYSAGSRPSGAIQPMAAELAAGLGYDVSKLRSKSWDEFERPDAPQMDIVITVCDNAAGEACPVWLGSPMTAHWGVDDPAAVEGDESARRHAYMKAFSALRRRVELLLALPVEKLERLVVQQHLREIGANERANDSANESARDA
ncbi:MAG: arsenate reductase ArsC [Xanthomonadaceae bacterium]|nr:arsenate reductase ArsC [Xanthomonadaceae bacterium]